MFPYSLRQVVLAILAMTAWLGVSPARADDGMFPPSDAARSFINFDGKGFLVNGKREFIVSGSLHYPRLAREQWRDRLLKFKRAGFNTVQTYVFWNYQEPQEGKWSTSPEADLDAFLKLVKELGMYATVRVGPYVCAEWDSGGYPVWLRFKPGVLVREDNPEFEAAVDQYLDKIMPVVAANQINRGGAVIMVQLENEHPRGWGRDMNPYFKHLQQKALALGLEVPYFFSGLHHGGDPAGNRSWDSKGRTNPWYSTEFWPGWYSNYGPVNRGEYRGLDRGAWKVIAYGGNGWNFYMLYGGTDFDTWNDDEVTASYDYGGAVGEAGDLRPIYYRFKRAATFATSFPLVLEQSVNADARYQDAAVDKPPAMKITARQSPAGSIVFLDNTGNLPLQTKIKASDGEFYPSTGPLTIPAGNIMPVVLDYTLAPDVTLETGAGHILGVSAGGHTTTVVTYGFPGEAAEFRFKAPAGAKIAAGGPTIGVDGDRMVVKTNYPTDSTGFAGVQECRFTTGDEVVRILLEPESLVDSTWITRDAARNYVVIGPHYVGDIRDEGDRLSLVGQQGKPGGSPAPGMASVYGPEDTGLRTAAVAADGADPIAPMTAPQLTPWVSRPGYTEAAVTFDDGAWKGSDTPLPMGADGDISAYAWYRSIVKAPKAGVYDLNFSACSDWAAVFVNGESAGATRRGGPASRHIPVTLHEGDNSLAVLTAHYGRPKLFGYLGPIDKIDAKGLSGPVTFSAPLAAAAGVAITVWKWTPSGAQGRDAGKMAAADLDTSGPEWTAAKIGEDVFNKQAGFAWFRTTLPASGGLHHVLTFESVDDKGTIYLNGKKLLHHEGWDSSFEVPLDAAWRTDGPNQLAVLVENVDGVGGIAGNVSLAAAASLGTEIQGWKMRGGVIPPAAGDWQTLPEPARTATPRFYRATFQGAPPAEVGPHPILRLSTQGLSTGFAWLNGHNLGRYPQKVHVDGLYLPEPWIKNGENALIVFDEDGSLPIGAKLVVESAASRTVAVWSETK